MPKMYCEPREDEEEVEVSAACVITVDEFCEYWGGAPSKMVD
jgi:hypothetical protein